MVQYRLRDDGQFETITSQIVEYEKNIIDGSLVFIDMGPYYISALIGDFTLFEGMISLVIRRSISTNRKVRFVGDCAFFLFQNRHFEEWIALETWLHERAMNGSYMCPYSALLLGAYPYNDYKDKIARYHKSIIDASGKPIDLFDNCNIPSSTITGRVD